MIAFSIGWVYDKQTMEPIHPGVPLEIFQVKRGGRYLFRATCPSLIYPFKLSIDGHMLHVTSSDSRDIIEKIVHSVIINTGERYDFYIVADDKQNKGMYWIRAETLDYMEYLGKVRLFYFK